MSLLPNFLHLYIKYPLLRLHFLWFLYLYPTLLHVLYFLIFYYFYNLPVLAAAPDKLQMLLINVLSLFSTGLHVFSEVLPIQVLSILFYSLQSTTHVSLLFKRLINYQSIPLPIRLYYYNLFTPLSLAVDLRCFNQISTLLLLYTTFTIIYLNLLSSLQLQTTTLQTVLPISQVILL